MGYVCCLPMAVAEPNLAIMLLPASPQLDAPADDAFQGMTSRVMHQDVPASHHPACETLHRGISIGAMLRTCVRCWAPCARPMQVCRMQLQHMYVKPCRSG